MIQIGPQPGPQTQFLASKADIAFFGGGAGGGKSYALLLEPLRHHNNELFRGVIFRRESPQITNPGGLWDESSKLYALLSADPKMTTLEWRFPHGAVMKFAHMQYDTDVFSWQGSQFAYLGFDEVTHFSSSQFWYMISRLRSDSQVSGYVRATCNPDPDSFVSKLLDWWIGEDGFPIPERSGVLRWFIRDGDDLVWADSKEELISKYGPQQMPKSLTFIPSMLADNKILMERDPGYLSNLLALPLVDRARLLGGNWKIRPAAGLYFKRSYFEVIDETNLPSNRRTVRYWDRACLSAGTKIKTDTGLVPIQKVKAGDLVYTRDGLKRVKWSGVTKKTNEIVSVLFSNGSAVTGTKDHLVWTENREWIELSSLTAGDIVCTATKSTSILTTGIKKIKDMFTGLFTGKSTNSTLVASPMAITSTTRTETGLITTSRILSAYQGKSTHSIIKKISHLKLTLRIQRTKLKHAKLFLKEFKSLKSAFASLAEKLITKNHSNLSIASLCADTALEREVGVYDLTIQDKPEFYADGILVHNSTEAHGNNNPDWTAGVKMSVDDKGTIYVEHVERIQGTPKTVEDCIKNIASSDGGNVTIVIEEDPGQAGKFESSYYVKALAGYTIKTNPVRENKITRAGPFSSQAEHGNVKIVRGKWNDAYISELESFPTKSSKDDQVDASSGAFKMLTADNIGSFSKDGNLAVSNTRANSLNSKRGW